MADLPHELRPATHLINQTAPSGPEPSRGALANVIQVIFFATLVKAFMGLFIGLRVHGRDNLPRCDPFVLVANHSSHLDTVSLLSLFPLNRLRNIRPVAAADYFERNWIFAWLTRTLFNTLPIARKDISPENDPVLKMQQTVEAGQSIIVFPEGTRGSGGQIGKFHSGVARVLEKLPHVPVVPASLINMGRSLPKGEYIPVPFLCEVRLGSPRIIPGTRQQVLEAIETAVRQLAEMS